MQGQRIASREWMEEQPYMGSSSTRIPVSDFSYHLLMRSIKRMFGSHFKMPSMGYMISNIICVLKNSVSKTIMKI
jgi:hypothetical protein